MVRMQLTDCDYVPGESLHSIENLNKDCKKKKQSINMLSKIPDTKFETPTHRFGSTVLTIAPYAVTIRQTPAKKADKTLAD